MSDLPNQLERANALKHYAAIYLTASLLFGALGFFAGWWLYPKLYPAGLTKKRLVVHIGLALLFIGIALYLIFYASIYYPGWVSRIVMFFAGYYLAMIRSGKK